MYVYIPGAQEQGSQAAEGVDREPRHQQRRDHRGLRQQRAQPGGRHGGTEHRDVQRLRSSPVQRWGTAREMAGQITSYTT